MGTRFELFLAAESQEREHLEAVANVVFEEIVKLDGALSRFEPRSEVSRLNREAAAGPVRVDREIFRLLQKCDEARRSTGGYFDVTASHKSGTLQLDAESSTLRFREPGVMIDLGGVGKGYALDRAHEIMQRFNVTCGLLNGGTSSVLACGRPHGTDGWPVAIRCPLLGEPVVQLKLVDRSLSCSAARHPDQELSDVIDPLTETPVRGDAVCLVLAANATEAEILSTALLAMGRERAVDYLAARPDTDVNAGWYEPGGDFIWIK